MAAFQSPTKERLNDEPNQNENLNTVQFTKDDGTSKLDIKYIYK